ncbi:MlaD family protein [Pedomonas mirosovicensis]|uniref:MlaD family protein n=1 Tax=Pedomonas mirosovicensis TaxID=2908641 RepID=UPI0021695D78|nr:MlaD family protein [Pedomonas mirosovicensis]MCH8684979.1 MCE family protein [Pedomonas mirosovicensis]
METKANHVLIGAFVLALIAALFGFVLWLSRLDQSNAREYDIFFTDSVTGLDVGGDVRFNGVPIGQVKQIALFPNDPRHVRVRVSIASDAPILQGTTATLEPLGITGIVFVQLYGTMVGAPPLTKEGPYGVPVIPSRPSSLSELVSGAPQLLQQATVAVTRLAEILGPENRASITQSLKNVERLTQTVANRSPEIDQTLVELASTMAEVRTAAENLTHLSQSANALVDDDVRPLMADLRRVSGQADKLVAELNAVVAENRPAVSQFTRITLPEATRLIIEMRDLMRSIQQVTERLEDGPAASLLSGNKVPEYDPSQSQE